MEKKTSGQDDLHADADAVRKKKIEQIHERIVREKERRSRNLLLRCPFLLSVCTISLLAGAFSLAGNIISGQTPMQEYLAEHLTVPFWADLIRDPDTATDTIRDSGKEPGLNRIVSTDSVSGQKELTSAAGAGEENSQNESETAQLPPRQSSEVLPGEVTQYTTYTPQQISSPYYQDCGKVALTTAYPYQKVDDSYFADAAFIGDSRMLGIHDYSGWEKESDFYCDSGFSLYEWSKDGLVMDQRSSKKVNLSEAMQQKKYGKIYVMIGMNDLGYGTTQKYSEHLQALLTMLRKQQPDAILYLMANLHIAQAKNDSKGVYNNINTNDKNAAMAAFADGQNIFYLDENTVFTDEQGYLVSTLTFDGFHLYASGYQVWAEYIREHAVVR